MAHKLKILLLKGNEILPYIPNIANLRIEIFRSYPYLYEGDLNYENNYLRTYTKSQESIMIIVLDQDKLVGVSSAIPLSFETIEFQKPFIENKIPLQDIFYFGESVLQAPYRGRGIYRHFFKEREARAREYGSKIAVFAAIERPPDDPKKPNHYKPLDLVWNHFGYEKHPELRMQYEWKEIGESTQSPKTLIFWLKKL